MFEAAQLNSDVLCAEYFAQASAIMRAILTEERDVAEACAARLAEQIAADRLIHVYGPGGHSNLASQEIFFRAGGLMHVSAMLDEGTLLSNGALRSMAMERTPGYGRVVVADQNLGPEDLLILVNAYGMNAALIDAAMEAKKRGVFLIGVSSRRHAEATAPDHPARHPTKQNLHDLTDLHFDTKLEVGDAGLSLPGISEKIGPLSTFANAFALNCLVIRTVARLASRGIEPPIWRSGNAPGGDEANARFLARFRERVRKL